MFFLHYISDGGGIDRTATCSHETALKRCQSHRGVDTFSVLDGTERRPVSEMESNKAEFFGLLPEKFGGAAGKRLGQRGVVVGACNGLHRNTFSEARNGKHRRAWFDEIPCRKRRPGERPA